MRKTLCTNKKNLQDTGARYRRVQTALLVKGGKIKICISMCYKGSFQKH